MGLVIVERPNSTKFSWNTVLTVFGKAIGFMSET
jgi:hypothetical protein